MTKTTTTIAAIIVAPTVAKAFKTYEGVVVKTKATREAARVTLHETLVANGLTTYDLAYPLANAWAATAYGVPMVEGKGPKTGQWVMDSTHASYEAAKFARRTVLEAFKTDEAPANKAEASAETVTPATEAQKALFAAFVAASANKANAKAVFAALIKG